MIGSGILPPHLPITSPIWDIDGFHLTFLWWIHSIKGGICSPRFLNGESILIPSGIPSQNLKLPTLRGALLFKDFPWDLGSNTLGFLIPDAPSVVNLNLFCIYSGFVNILKTIGTGFMISSSLFGLNLFLGS